MKIKTKIIISITIVLLATTGCSKIKNGLKKVEDKVEKVVEKVSLMQFDKYKDIVIDKVKSIQYVTLTEAGRNEETITDKGEIKRIYNNLKSLKIVQEASGACDDNTKIYTFQMDDGNDVKLELECNYLVLGNKRYEVK